MKPKTIKTQEGAGSTNVRCIDRFHNLRGSTVVIATSCIFLLYSQLVWHLAGQAPIYVKSSLCSESLLLIMMKHFVADKRQKNLTILESAPVANSTRLLNPKQNQNEWREWKFDIQQQIISCPWPSFTDHLLSCLAVDFSLYMLQIDPQHKAVNRFCNTWNNTILVHSASMTIDCRKQRLIRITTCMVTQVLVCKERWNKTSFWSVGLITAEEWAKVQWLRK
jgi:hypothetical protein